jgi:Alginate lyase
MLALLSGTALTLSVMMLVPPNEPSTSSAADAFTSALVKPSPTPSTTGSASPTAAASDTGSANPAAGTDADGSGLASDATASASPSDPSTSSTPDLSDAATDPSPSPTPLAQPASTADSMVDALPEPGELCGDDESCIPDSGGASDPALTDTPTPGDSPGATPTPGDSSTPTPIGSPSGPGGTPFEHPGILETLPQLNFVAAQIAANAEPWTSAFQKMAASDYASLAYTPSPVADVSCGSFNSNDHGCNAEDNDARASYTQALMWAYTGNTAYAQKAIQILNAWSSTLQSHGGTNAPLVSAWTAEMFTRAAEIIRYTGAGWTPQAIQTFTNMLNNIFLPGYQTAWAIKAYSSGAGNWELSMADAKIDIGIFTNNVSVFNDGVTIWQHRVPAYLYLNTDGPQPAGAPNTPYATSTRMLTCYWLNRNAYNTTTCPTNIQTTYANGQSEETCRDYVHFGLGIASILNAAETARIQGVNLYQQQQTRIVTALEYNTNILNTVHSATTYPTGFCNNATTLKAPYTEPTYEIGYNEYANRLGIPMPNTKITIQRLRATGGTTTDHNMAWETLTTGDVGLYGY